MAWQVDTIEQENGQYRIDSLRSADIDGQFWDMMTYVTIEQQFGKFTVKGGLQFNYDKRRIRFQSRPVEPQVVVLS